MSEQSKKKSIAFYIGSLSGGGAERVIVNLASYFHRCGYCVTIVTKLKDTDEYSVPKGVTRILADITGDEISKNRIINLYRRIVKLRNIWKQRRNHPLAEWHMFCDWIATLPYAENLIIYKRKDTKDV